MKNGWEDLANAIVMQAIEDYREMPREVYWPFRKRKIVSGGGKDAYIPPFTMEYNRENVDKEIEMFFKGNWFGKLSTMDGDYIFRNMKSIVDKERRAAQCAA